MALATQWIVITGAPSSGKTSVVEELARRGFAVSPEAARAVIAEKLAAGLTLTQVRADGAGLQRDILARKIADEKALDPERPVFLDRAIPDSIAYFRLAGIDTAPALAAATLFRYRAVFLFDRLPLVKDGIRSEDEARACAIDRMLEEDHRALGYAPLRVPVMPVAARADFILENTGHAGG